MKETGLITGEYVNTVIRKRKRELHKGEAGRVLVIAGSKGMAGAAILCCRGALRAGAGLVTAAVPEALVPILQTAVPEATCITRETFSNLELSGYDAIAAGPGLGDDAGNVELIERILNEYGKTVVLDADGLNTLARCDRVAQLKRASAQVIITPHMGEARRLLSMIKYQPINHRQALADKLVETTGATVVLKGPGTLVTSVSFHSYTNTTGNPGMATGGTGDVLTGIIAALAGQGLSPLDAARAGVYVHGLAGDLAAEMLSEYGMTAGDLADMTALAFKKILKSENQIE